MNDHQGHLELAALLGIGALPIDEVADVEAHVAGCEECQAELAATRQSVDALSSWPTDVLRPSTDLWSGLTRRIAAESGQAALIPEPARPRFAAWEDVAPGISCMLLASDAEKQRISMLVRLAPGAAYPAHRHAGVEELHLLHGQLVVDEKKLSPGDYLRSEPGTSDRLIWSETGCACVLITSTRDVLTDG